MEATMETRAINDQRALIRIRDALVDHCRHSITTCDCTGCPVMHTAACIYIEMHVRGIPVMDVGHPQISDAFADAVITALGLPAKTNEEEKNDN